MTVTTEKRNPKSAGRTENRSLLRRLTYSAVLLALAFVLPMLTGRIPEIGRALSPMHIPAMLAGFLLPWPWAAGIAFIMPIFVSAINHMPPMVPVAVTMAFEMAAYALVIALLRKSLSRGLAGIYGALLAAMVIGRIVYIIAFYIVMVLINGQFNFAAVATGLTVEAIPALILQLVIIPPIVLALQKARLAD